MNNSEGEFSATLTSLQSRSCHVSREWLTECINFFRSENTRYLPTDLQNFVYDQWLLGDLREIAGFGSFPPNLGNSFKITLEGKMACQVESLTDIGHSSYTQMQKVRNEDVGNLLVDDNAKEFQQAWEPKANRMIQLSLCDGSQTFKGIEYRPISFLKTDWIPGTKILIKGPVLCRRGILMLEERHVELLGGEVDALVITNAYENILAQKLNLPENPDPYRMTEVANQLPPPQPANPPPPQQNDTQARRQVPGPPPQLNNAQQPVRPPPQLNNVQQSVRPPAQSNVNGMPGRPPPPPLPTTSGHPKRLVQPTLSWAKQTQQPTKISHSRSPQPQPIEFTVSDEDLMNIPLNAADWETEMEYQTTNEGLENSENLTSKHKSGRPHSSNISTNRENLNPRNNIENSVLAYTDEYNMGSDEEDMLLRAEADLGLNHYEQESIPNPQSTTSKAMAESMTGRDRTETSAFKRSASSALSEDTLRKPLFAKRRKETSSQEVSSTSDLNFLIDDDFLSADEIPLETSQMSTGPLDMASHPFVYLSQIINQKYENSEIFRVKAAVITIVDKLSISDNEWKLSAKISDGSAKIDVRLSSRVLEDLIGMSPTIMKQKKKEMSKEHVKNEIRKVLENAQRRFIHLNCLLDIKMDHDQDLPVVVGFEEITSCTVSDLKKRRYVF